MIDRIIEFSMRNRWLVLGVYVALAAWGYWALLHTPIDAIPDLSENQVIVFTDWPGRSPQEVEDQITYPLTVNMQGDEKTEYTTYLSAKPLPEVRQLAKLVANAAPAPVQTQFRQNVYGPSGSAIVVDNREHEVDDDVQAMTFANRMDWKAISEMNRNSDRQVASSN